MQVYVILGRKAINNIYIIAGLYITLCNIVWCWYPCLPISACNCACQTLGTVVAGAYELLVHALLTWLQNKFKELGKKFCIQCMTIVVAIFRLTQFSLVLAGIFCTIQVADAYIQPIGRPAVCTHAPSHGFSGIGPSGLTIHLLSMDACCWLLLVLIQAYYLLAYLVI